MTTYSNIATHMTRKCFDHKSMNKTDAAQHAKHVHWPCIHIGIRGIPYHIQEMYCTIVSYVMIMCHASCAAMCDV